MGSRLPAALIPILILTLEPLPTDAATWTVARDGSAQFTEIQAAIDAAAAGDTIVVGPGRYDQAFRYEDWSGPFPAGIVYEQVIAVVSKPLAILGAGPEQTFIGPAQPQAGWVGMGSWGGSTEIPALLQDMTIENLRWAVDANLDNQLLDLSHCRIRACTVGVLTKGDLTDCEFLDMDQVAVWAGRSSRITNCRFAGAAAGIRVYDSAEILDCTFTACAAGVVADFGSSFQRRIGISRCTFGGDVATGISLSGAVIATMDSCTIRPARDAVLVSGPALSLTGRGNVLQAGGGYALFAGNAAAVSLSGGHLLPGAGYRIVALANYLDEPPVTLDLTGNWWGGLTAAEIRPRILDGHATPMIKAFVEFEPMADGPLPAEPTGWGGLRGLYR